MQSSQSNSSTLQFLEHLELPGDPNLWISLMTGPLLLGILGTKALSEVMQQVGIASEELFRGDRLPLLNLPKTEGDEPNRDKDAD
jgi:hypothetical protein